MFDLNFQVESVSPSSPAVAAISVPAGDPEGTVAAVQSILLKCQIRIEPDARRYPAEDPERLLDLFGTPDRWGKTMRSMLWTQVQAIVPAFAGETTVELAVPCTFDFNVAATKYFAALEEGEVPLVFLFSGTVFYQAEDGRLQVAPISLEKQADFRLPVGVWRQMMDHYYPPPPGSASTGTSATASSATRLPTACPLGKRRSRAFWRVKPRRWLMNRP